MASLAAGAISIHALREEGDPLDILERQLQINISIHALREEGDLVTLVLSADRVFLSTPSARRATSFVPG